MERSSDQFDLATWTDLKRQGRVKSVSACTGAFTLAGHMKGSSALWAAVLGKENLKIKGLHTGSVGLHVIKDTIDLKQGI